MRFLVEVPHGSDKGSCEMAIRSFLESGSHFLTNADWGCMDDDHRAWIVMEIESKEMAEMMLPPLLRPGAKIIELRKFEMDEMEKVVSSHD